MPKLEKNRNGHPPYQIKDVNHAILVVEQELLDVMTVLTISNELEHTMIRHAHMVSDAMFDQKCTLDLREHFNIDFLNVVRTKKILEQYEH